MSQPYLLVLGDREAIVWVLREQRMAFPATPRAEVAALAPEDRLLLYATRGAWHNPTRDRGRVIGAARVVSAVLRYDEPIQIAGRQFHSGCRLRIESLVPYPAGVELAPLANRISAFPKSEAWSVYLRRPLVRLSPADTELIDSALVPMAVSRKEALPTYVAAVPSS